VPDIIYWVTNGLSDVITTNVAPLST